MFNSSLYDEKTFYRVFLEDLEKCEKEVIIESPYITTERMKMLRPTFARLINKKVKVFVITRDPKEHNEFMAEEAEPLI